MATERKLHTIMAGATKVAVILPDIYQEIGSTVGIDQPTGTAGSGADTSARPADLLKSGQALKIRVRYLATGSAFGKTSDVLCDIDKAKTAVAELMGKTFKGGTIKSAYFARRARLG